MFLASFAIVAEILEPRDLLAQLASKLDTVGGRTGGLKPVDLAGRARLLHIARDVAHATERQNAPLAAYLVGRFVQVAVSSGVSEADALEDAAAVVRALIGDEASG
jgi:hypothetical protein